MQQIQFWEKRKRKLGPGPPPKLDPRHPPAKSGTENKNLYLLIIDTATFTELCVTADERLFARVIGNSAHTVSTTAANFPKPSKL